MGLEALQALQEWEKWVIKDSDYKNHRRFTLRCINKGIIQVSIRLKSTSNSRSRRAGGNHIQSRKTATSR